MRSLAFAEGQWKKMERRLQTAEEELLQVQARKQGKKRLTEPELRSTAQMIVQKHRVEHLLAWQVQTTTQRRVIRKHGDRPPRVEQTHEHQLQVQRCPKKMEQSKREMGWRVYATNH